MRLDIQAVQTLMLMDSMERVLEHESRYYASLSVCWPPRQNFGSGRQVRSQRMMNVPKNRILNSRIPVYSPFLGFRWVVFNSM